MSGGGGGRIIIRRAVKTVASLYSVATATPEPRKARLLAILAKDESNWTAVEFHFVLRCIADAQDDCE